MVDFKAKLAEEREKRRAKAGPKSSAPDMNTTEVKRRTPKEPAEPEIPLADLDVLESQNEVSLADATALKSLMAQHIKLGIAEREAAEAKEPLTDAIKKLVSKSAALHRISCNTGRLEYFPSKRSSIKLEKLLANGVAPSVIADSTEVSTSWTLKVRALGSED